MQTFGTNGAACKAAMQQGQVIVLNDTRGNQKYRVKKMPDGNVWMIDNLKLGSKTQTTVLTPADSNVESNYTLPAIDKTNNNVDLSETTYCSASGEAWIDAPGSLTGCGYAYNWNTAQAGTVTDSGYSISAKGWSITKNSSGITNAALGTAMLSAASDSNGKRNPVYSTTNYKNWAEGDTGKTPPWAGLYSGYVGSSFADQDVRGTYWTNSECADEGSYYLAIHHNNVWTNTSYPTNKTAGLTLRSVL
jgi:hypothetical protein